MNLSSLFRRHFASEVITVAADLDALSKLPNFLAIRKFSELQRSAVAHGEHQKRIDGRDENWPAWYADYMVAERAATKLPT
jgi:hypothetical protein